MITEIIVSTCDNMWSDKTNHISTLDTLRFKVKLKAIQMLTIRLFHASCKLSWLGNNYLRIHDDILRYQNTDNSSVYQPGENEPRRIKGKVFKKDPFGDMRIAIFQYKLIHHLSTSDQ
ncbi:hypothetical protein RF11_01308 [Thelohanellus kitauei]|uniref:Uncharacterized protein n=1 Tax=Thelohanellus kitauei TaxID=669202 RepID=A0A0C2JA27_THEKT|nr:hypothetical protein RF11_01308 [Thelohanellus kitauei]